MPSEFVDYFTRGLTFSTSRPASPRPLDGQYNVSAVQRSNIQELHSMLAKSQGGVLRPDDVRDHVRELRRISFLNVLERNDEESTLREALVGHLTVALYANALDKHLFQAAEVEAEADWWADTENSSLAVSLYLLQTLPFRISRVIQTALDTTRANHSFSTLSSSSLRSIFSSPNFSVRPSLLTATFFPHLCNQQNLTLAVLLPPITPSSRPSSTKYKPLIEAQRWLADTFSYIVRFIKLPIELTRQECRHNRRALEKIRDQRAEVVGKLAQLRPFLRELTHAPQSVAEVGNGPLQQTKYTSFLETLRRVVIIEPSESPSALLPFDLLDNICLISSKFDSTHVQLLEQHRLLRPSLLTRLWPSLLVLPPMSLYIYRNYTYWIPTVLQMTRDAKQTVYGFIEGWLVEPLLGVLRTVRTGGGENSLVHQEGVTADLESLERMSLSLARDRLNYTSEQLQTLAEKVRLGDLTPVMQAYEEDIRAPLRSALTGTLLRSLFIQLQKAKVDIDQALAGIDRLLKSQELTFAFVGVAPSLTIVYIIGGFVIRTWSDGVGRGKWGGKSRRRGVWEGMRRVERLLIKQSPSNRLAAFGELDTGDATLAPLATGLLILSLTRLRSYGLNHLPANIREPFLADLGDLEDPELGREAKLRVVDRIWRCWGSTGAGVIRL